MRRGWTEKSIDELAAVGRGKSRHRPRNDPSLYGGDYPFVQTASIHNADLWITSFKQTYSDKGLAQSKMWEPGTICITNAGENTGDCAILGIRACIPDSIIAVIADAAKSDAIYLKYAIDTLKPRLRRITRGATQDNLSLAKLTVFKFPTPPAEEQRRLGALLRAYGDLIENNRQRIQLLEQAARLLYKEWFVHHRFPGHEHVTITHGVPEGWEKKSAFDVMDVLSGGTPKTKVPDYWDGTVPFFTPKDATDYAYAFSTEKSLTEDGLRSCNSKLYPRDTVFITARGTVGKINLAQTDMAMNQSCYALVAKPPINQHFLYFALVDGVEQFRSRAVGAVFDAIIRDTFKLIPFVVPDNKLIRAFTDYASPILGQLAVLSSKTRKLIEARDLLLPRLMNGEVAV